MLRKIGLFFLMFVFIGSVGSISRTAQAQDVDVQTIPVYSKQFGMKLSPDGKTLVTFETGVIHADVVSLEYLPIRLIDIPTGEEKRWLMGHTDYAFDAAFTPDGAKLATYHSNGYIYLWDVATGNQIKQIPTITGYGRIQFLPDGQTLVILQTGYANFMLLMNVETGFITKILTRRFNTFLEYKTELGEKGPVEMPVAFDVSPPGKSIATATMAGAIWLWDVHDGKERLLQETENTQPVLNIRQLDLLNEGDLLVYADTQTKTINFLVVETGEEIRSLPADARALAVSDDGASIAWYGDDTLNYLPDVTQPDSAIQIDLSFPEGVRPAGPMGLTFTPDARQLVFGGFASLDAPDKNVVFVITLPE